MSWAAIVGWWSNNPIARMVTYVFLFLLGWEVVKRHLKEAGREAERAAIAKKQAQVRVAVNERSTEIIEEARTHADEAIAARDSSPVYPNADSLPDEIGRVAIRDFRGGKTPQ